MQVKVIIYYLELNSPEDLRPKKIAHPELRIEQVKIPCPEYNRFLYEVVGRNWNWLDKLTWTDAQWQEYVNRPELQTWVAYFSRTPCGYFELEKQADHNVQIVYFGLLPQFVGQGLGGHLLTEAVERAWQMDARRVWVHTCTLDHPAALNNYQARGFKLYQTIEKIKEIP